MTSPFTLISENIRNIRMYNIQGRTLEFQFTTPPTNTDPVLWFRAALDGLMQRSLQGCTLEDQVGVVFESTIFKAGSGYMPFKYIKDFKVDDLMQTIASIFQSNSAGLQTDKFRLSVTTVSLPHGSGKRKSSYNSFQEACDKQSSIIKIKNTDNLCLVRAIVVAIAYLEKSKNWRNITKGIQQAQTKKTYELINHLKLKVPERGCGLEEIQLLQNFFQNKYCITVYQYKAEQRYKPQIMFKGPDAPKNINLICHNNHYNVITSLTGAFGTSYYCKYCEKGYHVKEKHYCIAACPSCKSRPRCPEDIKRFCNLCQRWFLGEHCFNNHLKQGNNGSVCETVRICESCLKLKRNEKVQNHICGQSYCNICKKLVLENHLCYMPLIKKKQPTSSSIKKQKPIQFIFYDLETRQDQEIDEMTSKHIPNLCVLQRYCTDCLGQKSEICPKCSPKEVILFGESCIERFCDNIFNQKIRETFDKIVVLGLNAGAFDHQFILNHIISENHLLPEVILNGTKLIKMTAGNVVFLDTMQYFPMKLSKIPKAFGLNLDDRGNSLTKGFFCHFFNTKENQEYIGPIPELKYFGIDEMMEDERQALIEWHDEQKRNNVVFNFKEELIKYCRMDTELLTLAALKFRELILRYGNVDPYLEACTIASTCSTIFRKNFLKPETIAIIPKNLYGTTTRYSNISIKWLLWQEKVYNTRIRHAGVGKEVKVCGRKVDGYCEQTGRVFEFLGCYFHGCPLTFKHNRDQPLLQNACETMNYRYEATMAKLEFFKKMKIECIYIWECEFRQFLKSNKEAYEYTKDHALLKRQPIVPRDALYGGRTENTVLYYKVKMDEKIKYYDVCSLYPYVCKYMRFPLGHPQVLITDEDIKSIPLSDVIGLVKCRVLPPQDLVHPVLPLKIHEKLMFVLCYKCTATLNIESCDHNEDERSFTGTFVSFEVQKAVQMGYKVLDIIEIWHYPKTEMYDPETKKGGIFTDMMNTFLKLKQEASGFPAYCKTEEQKQDYINEYFDKEGVLLEYSNIKKNPGLRSVAKLIINSCWGKFAQSTNPSQTQIVKTPEEFFNLLVKPEFIVNSVIPVNDEVLLVDYKFKDEHELELSTVNVVIAAFVTAHARLKLYEYLELLGTNALYFDTDSIVFVSKPGNKEPKLGSFLGDLTDELEEYGEGCYIEEACFGGPKNYSLLLRIPGSNETKNITKVKGIKLNYNATQIINHTSMTHLILNPEEEPLKIHMKNIKRTKLHEVVTKRETKIYRPLSLKRKFMEDLRSEPFGMKKKNEPSTCDNNQPSTSRDS